MISINHFGDIIDAANPTGGYSSLLHHVYFDESGTHSGSPAMALGAYVFERTQSARFARDWAKELQRIGIPFAHMTDCANGNGPYADLSMQERIDSNKRLIEHIKRRATIGFAVAVSAREYEKVMSWDNYPITPYAFCTAYCVTMIHNWATKNRPVAKFAYFFESGHEDQRDANRIINSIVGSSAEKTYASHTFVSKEHANQLQAADMLAWQVAHHIKRKGEGHLMPRRDYLALLRPHDVLHEMNESLIRKWSDLTNDLHQELFERIRTGDIPERNKNWCLQSISTD